MKNEEPSIVSQAVGTLLKPVSWLMEKIVPEKAIEGALTLSNSAAEWLTDADDILRDSNVSAVEELRTKSLELSDELANAVHNWAIGVAGALGLIGIAVGIPALITMSLR